MKLKRNFIALALVVAAIAAPIAQATDDGTAHLAGEPEGGKRDA
jgi:hypothetical protein